MNDRLKNNVRMFFVGALLGATVFAVATLVGCNTISGLAQDVGAMSEGTKAFLVKD